MSISGELRLALLKPKARKATTATTVLDLLYVGNIINAGDLARRRNEMAAEPHRAELQHQLLPEAHP